MTFIEIIDTFTYYGIDVVLLALVTAVVTQTLKLTLLKNVSKKLITFLPFLLGTLLFAIYADIRNLSFFFIFEEYSYVLENGISVGAVATLFYVLYEQFIRKKEGFSSTEEVIAALIGGYVTQENVETAAKSVAEAIAADATDDGAEKIEEILAEYADGEVSESEIKLISKLIVDTLAHLSSY